MEFIYIAAGLMFGLASIGAAIEIGKRGGGKEGRSRRPPDH